MLLTILKNCRLIDGISDQPKEDISVLIEDSRIREIGGPELTAQDAREIDLGGRYLMPGLIDAHFHAYTPSFDFSGVDRMPMSLLSQHARIILENALQRGFTTVRDAGGADFGLAKAVEDGLIAGPRIFFAGKALSQTGGHGDFRSPQSIDPCACAYNGALTKVVDGADEVRKAVREELRRGASQIKLMLSGGVLSPADPIWMPQFTDAEISAAVEEAGTRRSYVMAHVHTSEAALRCVKLGVRSIEHGTLIDAKTAREIAKHDAYVVPTLAIGNNILKSNEVSGLSDAMLEKAKAMRNQAIGAVETCYKAGALADLIVLDGNPLEDISVLADANKYLALVMKAGRIYRNKLNRE